MTRSKLRHLITVRDFKSDDIVDVLDYWLNPKHRSYHLARGTDPYKWINHDREVCALQRVIDTSIKDRIHSAATVILDGASVGHVLLNDIRDPVKRRLHFHMWRNKIQRRALLDTISLTESMIKLSLDYFFETHAVDEIIGDVAVTNSPANYVLKRMGVVPLETVEEAYLGDIQLYNRYVFSPSTTNVR